MTHAQKSVAISFAFRYRARMVAESPIHKNAPEHKPGPVVSLKKFDDELQIVWGEVYIPDIPDSQGDFMTAEEIRKMAYDFVKTDGSLKKIDVNHDNTLCGCQVVETFIVREDDPTFIEDAWVVGIHVPDDKLWQAIKSGEYNGLSMQALAMRKEGEVILDIPPIIVGKTDDDAGHEHEFEVNFNGEGEFLGGTTKEAAGHKHKIKKGTSTETAHGHSHRFSFVEGLQVADSG